MAGHSGLTISRDELVRLLGIPATTIYGWWQKGFIKPPKDPGSKQRQGTFTQDEALKLYLFSLIVRTQKRRLEDAAVVARYVENRLGVLSILASVWPRPIMLTVHPAYDIAAFNFSKQLVEIRETQEVNFYHTNEPISDEWDINKINRSFWEEVKEVEALYEKHNNAHVDLATLVEDVFRIYKRHHREIMKDAVVSKRSNHVFRSAVWSGARTYDYLIREAWAMQHIEKGLNISAWVNRYEGRHMTHFTLDVTKAVDRTAKLFDLPVKKS